MQMAIQSHPDEHRRPAALDLVAAGLLVATVVLHVVAMFPGYFIGGSSGSSLTSSPDQAALYAVLAASWALALVVGLTGPHRTPVAAGLAVGLAAGELGFRVADLGDAFRYGTSSVGAGLWLMEAAWLVGAAAAATAVLAARRRHRVPDPVAAFPSVPPDAAGADPAAAVPVSGPVVDPARGESHAGWAAPGAAGQQEAPVEAAPPNPYAPDGAQELDGAQEPERGHEPGGGSESDGFGSDQPAAHPSGEGPVPYRSDGPTTAMPLPGSSDPTSALPVGEPTGVWDPAAGAAPAAAAVAVAPDREDAHERAAWTMLVAVLAVLVAGAFLPAWDHAVAFSSVTGQRISRSLGNAFSGPWQQVIGTVLAAVAMAAVPIVAVRLRQRKVGAAAVCGVLLVLGSQLTAAVVQVDQPLSPTQIGLSIGQARQLGVQLALKLTGWFTVDALAAYALFAAVMVWATLRLHQENSPGTPPSAPDARREAIPWAS